MSRAAPNLLFVFADQMRGMDLGCAGNPEVRTPNLDRLAGEGLRFTHAYANCPVCTPSRASLLTGRYPLTCRVIANDLPLPEEEVTLAEILKEQGYRTGYVGKWHLDGVPRARFTPPGPRRQGFDYWAVWNCAHDYFNGQVFRDTPDPISLPGYEPVGQTDLALEFLQQADDRPFCLFLSWGPPHDPYEQVPDAYKSLYDPLQLTLRPNVRPIQPGPHDLSGQRDPRTTLACYYAHITALDEQFGRLMAFLDEHRLADNTLVVFTSDHGDMLWSQGRMKKQQPWEESISIPFLVRGPGITPTGGCCDLLFSVVDMAPTLLAWMGFPVPEPMEGTDLSPALGGERISGPSSVFLMDLVTMDEAYHQGLREWRGLRTPRYTYARWADGAGWLLYDNEADPYQLRNRIDDPEAQDLRGRLEAELQEWLYRTGDQCLPWEENVRRLGLVDLWNARERELHPRDPRLLSR